MTVILVNRHFRVWRFHSLIRDGSERRAMRLHQILYEVEENVY